MLYGPGRAGQFRIPDQPTVGVARHVEFGDHADAAVAGVGHHVADVRLGVEIAVRAELLEAREAPALGAKALIVGEVPVKHVELDGGHGVQIAFDHLEGHPVARNVQHQAAPGEARAVFDVNGGYVEALRAGQDQLREGRKTVERAGNRGGLEARAIGGHVQLIRFVFAQRRVFGSGPRGHPGAFHAQRGPAGIGGPGGEHGDAGLPGDPRGETVEGRFQAWIGRTPWRPR